MDIENFCRKLTKEQKSFFSLFKRKNDVQALANIIIYLEEV